MTSESLFTESEQAMLHVIDILVARLGGDVNIVEAATIAADVPALIANDGNGNFRIVSSKGSDNYVLENRKDL